MKINHRENAHENKNAKINSRGRKLIYSILCLAHENFLELNEPRHEKTNILVSDLVRHKPGCTDTEDGEGLEILD